MKPEEIDKICTRWVDGRAKSQANQALTQPARAKQRADRKREQVKRWAASNPDKIRATQQRFRQRRKIEIDTLKKERAVALELARVFYNAWRERKTDVALADFYQLRDLLAGNGISKSILPITTQPTTP